MKFTVEDAVCMFQMIQREVLLFYYLGLRVFYFLFLWDHVGSLSRNTIVGDLWERSLMLYGVLLKQALLKQGLTAPAQMEATESHGHCLLPEMRVWSFNISCMDFGVKVSGSSSPLPPEGLFTNLLMSHLDDGAEAIEQWILTTQAAPVLLWSRAQPVVVYKQCSGITGLAPRFCF